MSGVCNLHNCLYTYFIWRCDSPALLDTVSQYLLAMLDKLPLEIVAEIIFYIDAREVDALLEIPAFHERFGDKILLVEEFRMHEEEMYDMYPTSSCEYSSDDDFDDDSDDGSKNKPIHSVEEDVGESQRRDDKESSQKEQHDHPLTNYGLYFRNITQRCKFGNLYGNIHLLNNYLCVIFVCEHPWEFEGDYKIPELHVHKKYFYTGMYPWSGDLKAGCFEHNCEVRYGTRNTFEFSTYDIMFDSFEWNPVIFRFNHLGTLRFHNTIVDTVALEELPELTTLVLQDCECWPESSTWDLPSLQTLEVFGKFETIEPLIDFESTELQRLYLNHIVDVDSLSNINNSSLLEVFMCFKIDAYHLVDLTDLCFQSVKKIRIEAESILISGLELPNAKEFSLSLCPEEHCPSKATDALISITAPKLEKFAIFGGVFEVVEDIDIPIWERSTKIPRTTS